MQPCHRWIVFQANGETKKMWREAQMEADLAGWEEEVKVVVVWLCQRSEV
jgi:hypothetical protein